jgi:hypothetical protein
VLVVVKEKMINFFVTVQLAAVSPRLHCAKPHLILIFKVLLAESLCPASAV